MTIQVQRPETGFSIIPDAIIQCSDLSAAARCLWAYLASLPPEWRPHAAQLQRALGVGRDKLQGLCKELEALGALTRQPARDNKGQVRGQHWILSVPDRVPEIQAGGATGCLIDRVPENQGTYKDTKNLNTKEVRERETHARALLPSDWFPSDAALRWAGEELAMTERKIITDVVAVFLDHASVNAVLSMDWNASFRIWVHREKGFQKAQT